MRRLGKEAYMFTYNGEPHGLRNRDNMKHWTVHMDEFFDHYLLGKPRPEWMDKGVPFLEKGQARRQPDVQSRRPRGRSHDRECRQIIVVSWRAGRAGSRGGSSPTRAGGRSRRPHQVHRAPLQVDRYGFRLTAPSTL